MTELTSVLEAARNAHDERTKVWQDDADSRVEDLSSEVADRLAEVLRLEVRHPSLKDMIWVARKEGQGAEDILAEPMVNVVLESALEGAPVRATLNEGNDPKATLTVEFEVWVAEWKRFASLAELGSHLR